MRNDGNTKRTSRRHHKPMHSARRGKGHDARIRKAKRRDSRELCGYCGWPVSKKWAHLRSQHQRK